MLWVGSADVGTNMPKFVKINNKSQTHLQKHENPRLMRGSRKEGRTCRLLNPYLHPNIPEVNGSSGGHCIKVTLLSDSREQMAN